MSKKTPHKSLKNTVGITYIVKKSFEGLKKALG